MDWNEFRFVRSFVCPANETRPRGGGGLQLRGHVVAKHFQRPISNPTSVPPALLDAQATNLTHSKVNLAQHWVLQRPKTLTATEPHVMRYQCKLNIYFVLNEEHLRLIQTFSL